MKKVIIATGGTGGHIYPAIALAKTINREYPDCHILFFGSSNRMEADIIPSLGYDFIGEEMTGMNGGISAKIKSLISILKAEIKCKKLIKTHNPDICVGFGNYISVPLIYAAYRLGVPTMIHEQNSYAGKANIFLGKYVKAIVGSYEENAKQFPADKFRLLGNPDETLAYEKEKQDIYKEYGFSHDKPLVFIMMGSLGSETVSKVMDEAMDELGDDVQFLLAKGKDNPYEFKCQKANVRIVDFVDGISALYGSDLSITRAGATTIAEITALGVATILIPSPYVPNNHQLFNALQLVQNNAAELVEEKDLSKDEICERIKLLLNDKERLAELKNNAYSMGRRNSAYDIVNWMVELTNDR